MLANLINNIAFLIALVAAGQVVISHGYKTPANRQFVLGLLFGGVSILGMVNPFTLLPGVIFDGRTIVLAVAGVVGGGVTAVIAGGLAAFCRYEIGGGGAAVGVTVAVLSSTFGVLARAWWTNRHKTPRWFDYVALGVAVQLMQLTAFTQIPNRAGYAFIEQAWWVLLLFYPLATMLLCLMFRNFEQQMLDKAELQRAQDARIAAEKASLQRFHAYFDRSIVGLAITSPDKGWIEVNDALCHTLGFSREDFNRMTWEQITHPDDVASDLAQFNRMLAGEIQSYAMDKRFIHKQGHLVYTRLAVSAVRKQDGSLDYVLAMVEDITDRTLAETALRDEKQFSVETLNALPGVFYMFDATGRFVRWNRQFGQISGYSDAELSNMKGPDFFAGEDRRRMHENLQQVLREGAADAEAHFQTKEGGSLPYLFRSQRATIGEQTYLLGVGLDISDRLRTQHALEIERAQLQTLISAIPDLIWLKDVGGRYVSCNREFERFFGAQESDIVGKTDYDFVPALVADKFRLNDRAAMAAGEPSRNEEWITYASDGRRVLLETTKVPIRTKEGRLLGVLGVGHDITERQAHQQQLEHIAHFDTLTGLPNRVLLADRLQQALAQAQRRKSILAVAYLDLDGFKAINDRYGHDAGDRLLKALTDHMRHALREVDTLARLGGDEFVAIYLDLPNIEASLPLLSRLLAAVSEVVQIDGLSMKVSGSLGVTYYPQDDAIDADQLLRQADQAMYQAKQMGKNRYHIFDAVHDRSVRGHHEELERLKRALQDGEFLLFYQPKVNMRTGEVLGAEALIRWQHPERGLLPPSAFLPMIADQPLAIDLGHWVLDTVMTQIEAWKATGLNFQISANIDAIHLGQADFVDRLLSLKAAHPTVLAGDLELEVLETNLIEDTLRVSQVIRACREMGVGFALDDFGTGYSSLTYLKQLPAELLKIDQSFVRDMLDQPDDLSILEGILGLAKAFRRHVIAEGVETLVHGEMLLRLGCDLAQGYAVARPMPAAELPEWVKTWRPDPSWQRLTPIGREQLPILSAWVEHRAWIKHLVDYLRGESLYVPLLHPNECRVGQWLASRDLDHVEQTESFQELVSLHIEIHDFANDLIELKQRGQAELLDSRVSDLYKLRDRFLERLIALLH